MASVLLKGGFLRRIAKETTGRKEKGRPTPGELNGPNTTRAKSAPRGNDDESYERELSDLEIKEHPNCFVIVICGDYWEQGGRSECLSG